tara:strand:- start:411 stop:653 length:243 start_codon:yes stop_codon:yes gene_type:complete
MTYKEDIIKEILSKYKLRISFSDYNYVEFTKYKDQYGSEHKYIVYDYADNFSGIQEELDDKGIKYKKSYPTHFEHGFILI